MAIVRRGNEPAHIDGTTVTVDQVWSLRDKTEEGIAKELGITKHNVVEALGWARSRPGLYSTYVGPVEAVNGPKEPALPAAEEVIPIVPDAD